jgi:beta-glucosidase
LSYTSFQYEKPSVSANKIKNGQSVTVNVIVSNTGKVAGDEIVQLYIKDLASSVTRPVMELKDFARVSLQAGEKKTVSFVITPDKLQFYNIDMKRVVEPGTFEVLVGSSSAKTEKVSFEVE